MCGRTSLCSSTVGTAATTTEHKKRLKSHANRHKIDRTHAQWCAEQRHDRASTSSPRLLSASNTSTHPLSLSSPTDTRVFDTQQPFDGWAHFRLAVKGTDRGLTSRIAPFSILRGRLTSSRSSQPLILCASGMALPHLPSCVCVSLSLRCQRAVSVSNFPCEPALCHASRASICISRLFQRRLNFLTF